MIENNALSRKILHFFLRKSKGGTMRCHFTPTKMAKIKKTDNKCGMNMEK